MANYIFKINDTDLNVLVFVDTTGRPSANIGPGRWSVKSPSLRTVVAATSV